MYNVRRFVHAQSIAVLRTTVAARQWWQTMMRRRRWTGKRGWRVIAPRLAPVPVGDDTCTTDILGEVQISRSWTGDGGHPEKYSSPQLRAASALAGDVRASGGR